MFSAAVARTARAGAGQKADGTVPKAAGSGTKRRVRHTLWCVAATIILGSCLPTGAEEVPYRMDASNQAGWWSPLAEQDGNVFVAYNGWGTSTSGASDDTHTVYVARRTAAGVWTRGC